MAKAKQLKPEIDCPSPTLHEEEERIEVLRATIEKYLPDFADAVKATSFSCASVTKRGVHQVKALVLHQDAFASGYHDDEYVLLGMAIKYAGLHGVEVNVLGRNHETF